MLLSPDTQAPLEELGRVSIKVVGVGGGGVNTVRRMAESSVPGVELLCINTDVASLETVRGVPTMAIGSDTTRGLGAGGNPEVGRRAAEETRQRLLEWMTGADIVFIAAGMGGGTGTGAAPVVAGLAKRAGALTVAVVTTPFSFEGAKRTAVARAGLQPLLTMTDTMIVVSNDRLLALARRRTTIKDSFLQADQVMVNSILGVSRVINVAGDINVDFADVQAVMSHGGVGVVAIGQGAGTNRITKAVQGAVTNPLMDRSAHGARSLLFVITGGPDLTIGELNDAGAYMQELADPDAQIFFGVHIDQARRGADDVDAVLIATHLPDDEASDPESRQAVAEKVKLATAHYLSNGRPSSGQTPSLLRNIDLS